MSMASLSPLPHYPGRPEPEAARKFWGEVPKSKQSSIDEMSIRPKQWGNG